MADEDRRIPTLGVKGAGGAGDTTAFSVTGDNYILMDAPGGGGGTPARIQVPELHQMLRVSTADIRGAEGKLLTEAATHVSHFEQFKRDVTQDETWVFFVEKPEDMGGQWGYQENPDTTRQIVDGQHGLIRAIGDSIEAIGQFTARLNDSAQLYADTEKKAIPRDV